VLFALAFYLLLCWAGQVRALQPLGRSIQDCGEFMSAPILAGHVPSDPLFRPDGGWILIGPNAEVVKPTPAHEAARARAAVWAHTQAVFAGNR